eukprot:CAMPEP_0184737576 /NCGR_PEP_ID=MMETSP0315-20130426/371_1 /TAXON_ID=101924 /ORGANISM="Rhodosorus marinus, Strain UTEX LB 2760" /LENGTH=172 /DNA_ID=CAMNT_0027204849 /DNA_START=39 /DNA_END=557 /DNA_ORIENTATION=-
MVGFISSTVYAPDRSTTKCAACSRREAMRAIGCAAFWPVLANIVDAPVLAVEVQPKGLEYYGLALDIRQRIKELHTLVEQDRLDELRYEFRSFPLMEIRKVSYYLANYTPEVGDKRSSAVKAYKIMTKSLEDLDHQALLVSRKQSNSNISDLLAKLDSNYDAFLKLIPNQFQ